MANKVVISAFHQMQGMRSRTSVAQCLCIDQRIGRKHRDVRQPVYCEDVSDGRELIPDKRHIPAGKLFKVTLVYTECGRLFSHRDSKIVIALLDETFLPCLGGVGFIKFLFMIGVRKENVSDHVPTFYAFRIH